MAEYGNSSGNTADGLRKLNKDLLTRNAELVKRLNRTKTERDNFEQLFIDWKKVNKDASETIHLLQRDNEALTRQLKDERLENQALRQQMSERVQQNNHLLRDLHRLNTLRFNHQQQTHEMEELLQRVQSLFVFVDSNHPHITRPNHSHSHARNANALLGIRENTNVDSGNVNGNGNEHGNENGDHYDDDFSSARGTERNSARGQRQARSKGAKRRKRRSLPMAVSTLQIAQLTQREHRATQQRTEPTPPRSAQTETETETARSESTHRLVIDNVSRESADRVAVTGQIAPQLLGPSTSAAAHPFKKTVSSHSFFSEHSSQQQFRYGMGAVKMKMALPGTKLWTKRDSLTGKRKKTRINAIPSSAGSTPLTTPQQSRRGNLDDHDDYDAPDVHFDEDPHHRYLEMLGTPGDEHGDADADADAHDTDSASTEPPNNGNGTTSASASSDRNKLTDKKTVHDLFDMLQQHTLATAAAAGSISADQHIHEHSHQPERDARDEREDSYGDAHLVPILEPSDSSSDSD